MTLTRKLLAVKGRTFGMQPAALQMQFVLQFFSDFPYYSVLSSNSDVTWYGSTGGPDSRGDTLSDPQLYAAARLGILYTMREEKINELNM